MIQFPKRRTIVVKDYDPNWKEEFKKIKSNINSVLNDNEVEIIHIGSTSIEGLAAKPIIDMIIVGKGEEFDEIKNSLAKLGYNHNGNQGIEGREVFNLSEALKSKHFAHHLYFCDRDARVLLEFRVFLDYLRNNPDIVKKYSEIKKEAAKLYPHDINKYMDHKGPFITKIMTKLLIDNNLTPENPDKQCNQCGSTTISSQYQMKYLDSGYKVEIYTNQCGNCDNIWEKEVSRA